MTAIYVALAVGAMGPAMAVAIVAITVAVAVFAMAVIDARLLDTEAAAAYLRVSEATIRRLVARRVIVPVRLPSVRRDGEAGRRLLFDRLDLDELVDRLKRSSTCEPNAGLSAAALEGWKRTPLRTRGARTSR